jgi:two-component system sensor histidine kinase RegB
MFQPWSRTISIDIDDVADRKNLLLLVQLRWLAVIGQVLTIVIVHFGFGIALPLANLAYVSVSDRSECPQPDKAL